MDTTTMLALVVLTSTGSCAVDNIDISEPTYVGEYSAEVCPEIAAVLDAPRGVRAFCVETN